jgi:hypothetical protein
MAIDYEFAVQDSIAPLECSKTLSHRLKLNAMAEGGRVRLYNQGLRVLVEAGDKTPSVRTLCSDVFGFAPGWAISMRPVLSDEHYELAIKTMMQVVELMFSTTKGDAGFSYEFERVHMLRKNGTLYLREDFESHRRAEDLAWITQPYIRKAAPITAREHLV